MVDKQFKKLIGVDLGCFIVGILYPVGWAFFFAGLVCLLLDFLEYLKHGERNVRSALQWIESDLNISVTWLGFREMLSDCPLALFFIVLGIIWFGLFILLLRVLEAMKKI
jgi:CDP-diglyceride synthetase